MYLRKFSNLQMSKKHVYNVSTDISKVILLFFFFQCQTAALDELFGNPQEVSSVKYIICYM